MNILSTPILRSTDAVEPMDISPPPPTSIAADQPIPPSSAIEPIEIDTTPNNIVINNTEEPNAQSSSQPAPQNRNNADDKGRWYVRL